MKYCKDCGTKLESREVKQEGTVLFCTTCNQYRYPLSNTAVSMIVLSPSQDRILLIQQYGQKDYILVAGYVDQKEALEEAMVREIAEELGRKVTSYHYMKSEYFEKTNTLMCNFVVTIDDERLDQISDWEVDHAAWFTFAQAAKMIKQKSLAQRFLLNFLERCEILSEIMKE